MTSPNAVEREALDEVERQLTAKGYTVTREPSRDQLPPSMGGFQPDAIATGKHPNLLIEVIARRGSASVAAAKIEQLRQLIAGDDSWRLEIVYTAPSVPDLAVSSTAAIRERFGQIQALAPVDRPATLIMAWSLLEATARALLPARAERPLTPASTVELLASMGFIEPNQAMTLREAGRLRNVIVHGDLTRGVAAEDIQSVLEIVGQLVGTLEGQLPVAPN
jgi:hypothetical protein